MIRVHIKTFKATVLFLAVLAMHQGAWAQGLANTVGTQSSLALTAYGLRAVFNMQALTMQENLMADAHLGGDPEWRMGLLGRDAHLTGQPTAHNSNLMAVVGKRLTPNWRVGLVLDQTLGNDGMGVANLTHGGPGLSVYGVWQPSGNDRNLQIHLSAGWSEKNMSVQRPSGLGAEAGKGATRLETWGYQVQGSSEYALGKHASLRPYAGLRYVRVADRGYTESSAVAAPLTLGAMVQESLALLLGVQAKVPLSPSVAWLASVGLEQDVTHQGGAYADTSQAVPGLVPQALNTIYNPTRGVLALALQAQPSPQDSVQLGVKFAEQAFASQVAVQVMLGYVRGL